MQIPNVATLNGLVVTLGQKQQEEFVPVGSHLIDDRGKVAEPREDLFADRSVLFVSALLQLLAVA